jgi:hypothetical protein
VIERINAVQRVFWGLLVSGLLVTALGVPVGNDGHTMAALDELTAFSAAFDRPTLERVLLSHASAQGVIGLDTVARAVTGRGVPKVSVAAGAAPIAPRATVLLSTLAEVRDLTTEAAAIAIAAPKSDAIARALVWRLSRQQGPRYELESVKLGDGRCTHADVQREQEVNRAREAALRARDTANVAEKQHAQAEGVYDLRRKWKATWKAIAKANETRQQTQATLDDAQKQLTLAEGSYEALVKQAEGFEAKEAAKPASSATSDVECVVAVARLTDRAASRSLELRLPVEIEQRKVAVPRITGADFPVLRSAGFWTELKDLSAQQATERLRQRFSWHYRYLDVGGMKLGGMTILQLVPLLFIPLFLGLIRRSRGVGATYNPFDRPAGETLPTVGVGVDFVNLIVLVLLPLTGCALCAWSLIQVNQPPVVPLLCAIGSIVLGGSCHVALKELLELRDAITRSHSNPPPATV